MGISKSFFRTLLVCCSILLAIIVFSSCEPKIEKKQKEIVPFAYAENVKFNHLYVVIDDSTYAQLFDSIPFFQEFAYVSSDTVDAGDESWSGKYISGNQDYLEIFKPGGAENTALGDLGIGFMPNKLGLIDSLYNYWAQGADSITRDQRNTVISEGDTLPWFNQTAIHDPDSLAITPWVMEYTAGYMHMAGFSDEDLAREISHAEFMQKYFSTYSNVPYDSAQYARLYERVTAIDLTLSEEELALLRKYLETFRFQEQEGVFSRADIDIRYRKSEEEHFILNQISFELRDSVPEQSHTAGNVTLSAKNNTAKLRFTQKVTRK